jgi:2-polyprenyl-3-methyl-5-hydroxy-6-metoxy-1,4-benzoquinol methylase
MVSLITTCISCESANSKKIAFIKNALLFRCANCKVVFSKLIPSDDELTNFYAKYPEYGHISPITFSRYNELLDEFEKYRKLNNILDIGCGNGFFLDAAKKRGWNVFGTEFYERSITTCRNKKIKIAEGKFTTSSFPAIQFDVITSFEVIEHTHTPMEEIKDVYSCLRQGGLLYITTPNFDSLSRHLLSDKWSVISYPEHLTYFNSFSLKYLFEKAGFKTLSVKTTGISFARIIDGLKIKALKSPSSFSNTKPNLDQDLREKIESNRLLSLLKSFINWLLTLTKKGDSLKAYFEKPE